MPDASDPALAPGPPDDAPDPGRLIPPAPAAPPAAPPIAEPVAREPSLWYLAAAGGLYAGLLLALVSTTDTQLLERADADPWTFLWLQALDDGLLAGVALLFGRARYPGSWWAMGLRAVSPRWWLFGGLGGGLAATLGWLTGLALERWGAPLPPHPIETLLLRAEGSHELAVVLLAVTVPVAIGEEIFFRGYAYRLLRARLGVAVAIVGSAVLFAAVHGLELGAWLPVLPVGLVFAVLAEVSGSVVPGMIGHAVVNALAVLIG
jgi:membrane protease YdiL (CAAX protease family)